MCVCVNKQWNDDNLVFGTRFIRFLSSHTILLLLLLLLFWLIMIDDGRRHFVIFIYYHCFIKFVYHHRIMKLRKWWWWWAVALYCWNFPEDRYLILVVNKIKIPSSSLTTTNDRGWSMVEIFGFTCYPASFLERKKCWLHRRKFFFCST